jgi:fumarylacetoacetase
MTTALNATHDPALRCWLETANDPNSDFPIQNLPFGVFRRSGSAEAFRGGVAIGDQVLDLRALAARTPFEGAAAAVLAAGAEASLNRLMALPGVALTEFRAALSALLADGSGWAAPLRADLVPQEEAEFDLPARIGNYTDFYSSIHHATAVGRLFRPTNPLTPNYRWMPIAYHGRASSIGVSDQAFHRPLGQSMPAGADRPKFGPSERLDYELELGVFIGRGNLQGQAIPIASAEQHVFGLCLLNDWSARDLQSWEAQPLGPFLGKNFATTISPWIVTLEALAPFRAPLSRPPGEPEALDYLESAAVRERGGFDIEVAVFLQTPSMRARGLGPERVSRSNYRDAYWSVAQMLAHHTVGGCNLLPGDLLGTGTLSGPAPEQAGSLLELSMGGSAPITLANGETRKFLLDGDRVDLRAACSRKGCASIGFGAASGIVLPPLGPAPSPLA